MEIYLREFRLIEFLLEGFLVSLQVAGLAIIVSLAGGAFLALIRLSKLPGISHMAIAYIDTVRPLPTFLILVVVYFGLARLRFGFSPIGAGVVGLACYHAARMAEVIRSGIQSVEKGQTLAARSLGLTYLQSMRYVVMPIGVRRMIPALTTEVLMVIKNTSLTLVVGVGEVLNRGQIIYSKYLNPVPTLLIVAALFWLTCYPLSRLSRKLEVAEETSAAL